MQLESRDNNTLYYNHLRVNKGGEPRKIDHELKKNQNIRNAHSIKNNQCQETSKNWLLTKSGISFMGTKK